MTSISAQLPPVETGLSDAGVGVGVGCGVLSTGGSVGAGVGVVVGCGMLSAGTGSFDVGIGVGVGRGALSNGTDSLSGWADVSVSWFDGGMESAGALSMGPGICALKFCWSVKSGSDVPLPPAAIPPTNTSKTTASKTGAGNLRRAAFRRAVFFIGNTPLYR